MDLTQIRHYLHKHPELSGVEVETALFISETIKSSLGFEPISVGQTGVLVALDSEIPGPITLFRGDIDALPIHESLEIAHQSTNKRISHKCGHDGHTTIMLGLLDSFAKHPIQKGKVMVLFQPAEENGTGAQLVLDDDVFSAHDFEYAFALHNIPGEKLGSILYKTGSFTHSVLSCAINLKGTESHAASPGLGNSPSGFIADLIQYANQFNKEEQKTNSSKVITVVFCKLGEQNYGIAPANGEIHLTIRASDQPRLDAMKERLLEEIKRINSRYQLEINVEWLEAFHANINHQDAVEILKEVIAENQLMSQELKESYRWGEDFGLISSKAKGCMFGVGAGEDLPPLHHPSYDFPDDLLIPCVDIFFKIAQKLHY